MTLPLLTLVGGHTDPSTLAPLVVALRPWCRPHAGDTTLGEPDAYLATSAHAPGLDVILRSGTPTAVVVDAATGVPDSVLKLAAVLVSQDPAAVAVLGPNAMVLPRDIVRASDHPPLTPFVRARWRERLGLPAGLVLRLGVPDPWSGGDDTVAAALAVAAAAVVRGPWLLTALALGTAVVTDAASAERIGATAHVHVAVASPTDAGGVADALAGDPTRAAALGWGGRLLVEERHDLDRVAVALLDRLGIGPRAFPVAPLANLDEELATLGTPAASSVAQRAIRRAAGVAGSSDWADLTGRRR